MPHTPGCSTPALEPLAVSVDGATQVTGVGRTKLYEALGTGDLASCKVGTRRLILLNDLRAWLVRERHVVMEPELAATVSRSRADAVKTRPASPGASR